VAELIREAALEGVRDELPHSIAVVVEEMEPRADRPADRPLIDVRADLYVERSSQKGIVIGHRGERLRQVGNPCPGPDRGPARHAGLPRPATSRSPRTGSATPSSSAASASDSPPSRELRERAAFHRAESLAFPQFAGAGQWWVFSQQKPKRCPRTSRTRSGTSSRTCNPSRCRAWCPGSRSTAAGPASP